MKIDYHKKKIYFIYVRLLDMFNKYRKLYKKIFQIRENMISKFHEFYRKDGEKYKVFWKGKEFGLYVVPDKPHNSTITNISSIAPKK